MAFAIVAPPLQEVAPADASRIQAAVAAHALLQEARRDDPRLCLATTSGGLSRGGTFSAELLLSLLLYLVADGGRNGYQTLLDGFWEQGRAAGIELPGRDAPAAASFCNARRRLRPEVVLAVLRQVAGRLLARRVGRRFFAVDGTRLHVQRGEELWRDCRAAKGSGSPQVQMSVLFSLDEEIPFDVEVGPFDASERAQCLAHLERLRRGDVLILDRGYPGFGLLRRLEELGIDFIVRAAGSSTFPALERFLASGRAQADVEIAATASFARSHPEAERVPLRVRAVRLVAPDGRVSAILSSLPRAEFPRREIVKLYRRRWRIEEYYKLVKSRQCGSGQLHAKTLAGVKQELYAQALYVAIARLLAAESRRPRARAATRPTDPIHVKAALHALAQCLVELLLCDDHDRIAALLLRVRERMRRRVQPPRPGRAHPRRSFLPSTKWCSTGRRGRTKR